MKKSLYLVLGASLLMASAGCIEEIDPQSATVTAEQAANAPNGYKNFVSAITSNLTGNFNYSPSNQYPYDYGLTSFFLARDVMGSDMALTYSGSWYSSWAFCGVALGPRYALCQFPWTVYYSWIKSCNTVISLSGENPEGEKADGAGIAYTMRAYLYMDLARMYAPESYGQNQEALTVPIVTETTSLSDLAYNARATNKVMFDFILSDLDKAETLIADYHREDVYTPDISVVYGLKARAYQWMEDWAKAEEYAKKAQVGYTMMTEAEYLDRNKGFNTPNGAWMLGTIFKADDPCILENDADSSWGSIMTMEIFHKNGAGCGYSSNYGHQIAIDHHLYNTIPESDFRRKCWIDFSIASMLPSEAEELCAQYSDYPKELANVPPGADYEYNLGGCNVKFRVAGGYAGRDNQYVGFLMAVPLMRVEEMKLIEIEAVGMQREGEGITMLTQFAQTRDPNFVYGRHNEAYYNTSTKPFQNEVWWQRRVELWGEGQSMYDIKRLKKGIIRSYDGTNHIDEYQWNSEVPPQWMTFCLGGTEPEYNYALVQNPLPVKPVGNSEPYAW